MIHYIINMLEKDKGTPTPTVGRSNFSDSVQIVIRCLNNHDNCSHSAVLFQAYSIRYYSTYILYNVIVHTLCTCVYIVYICVQ